MAIALECVVPAVDVLFGGTVDVLFDTFVTVVIDIVADVLADTPAIPERGVGRGGETSLCT